MAAPESARRPARSCGPDKHSSVEPKTDCLCLFTGTSDARLIGGPYASILPASLSKLALAACRSRPRVLLLARQISRARLRPPLRLPTDAPRATCHSAGQSTSTLRTATCIACRSSADIFKLLDGQTLANSLLMAAPSSESSSGPSSVWTTCIAEVIALTTGSTGSVLYSQGRRPWRASSAYIRTWRSRWHTTSSARHETSRWNANDTAREQRAAR